MKLLPATLLITATTLLSPAFAQDAIDWNADPVDVPEEEARVVAAPVAKNTLVVWNGESANRGASWASPHKNDADKEVKDTNFFKPQKIIAHSGGTALELKLEGAAWLGGGWNWHGWWPADAGTDTTPYTHLAMQLRLFAANPENLTVALACSADQGGTDGLLLAGYAKHIDLRDGAWHKIAIPLADFKPAEGKTFDRKTVWQISFGAWSQHERAFSLFIDDIAFENIEPKHEW